MEFGKTCIEIVGIPKGEIPREIREKWIGLRLPLETAEEYFGLARGVATHLPCAVVGYVVDAILAIAILELHHPDAALWWRENTKIAHVGGELIFDKDACRVVEELPSFVFPTEQKGMISVGEFFQRLAKADPEIWTASVQILVSYANFWEKLSKQTLTIPMILVFAKIVANNIREQLDYCASESTFNRLHREGHAALQKLGEAAQICGILADPDMVDLPLTFTDIGVKSRGLEITEDGGVRLTQEGEERIEIERRRDSAQNN